MTRTVREWYLGEEDKKEIKRFSKEISAIFKIEGYNPTSDDFEEYFNLEEFDFIPCVKGALDAARIEELEKIEDYLDSVYDPTVKVSLQDMINNAAKCEQTVEERLKEMLFFGKSKSFNDFVDFIFTCSDDTKQKFVSWLVG